MKDHRGSYRKAVLASGVVAGAALGMLASLGWLAVRATGWGAAAWVAVAVAVLLLVFLFSWSALVCVGGLESLRRDALETAGRPYYSPARQEWLPGPAVRALRGLARAVTRPLRPKGALALRPGDLVEVRSLEEILATLDAKGTLNGLPFMPEMTAFCGQRFHVFRRIDKLNDWVEKTGLRRVHDTVTLDGLRCNGQGHGGCQAWCQIRWNEAWLKRPSRAGAASDGRTNATPVGPGRLRATDLPVLACRSDEAGETRYTCQVTQLGAGTTPLGWRDPRHYLRDLVRGNLRFRPWVIGIAITAFNWAQRKRGGATFPVFAPSAGQTTTPHAVLDLAPGEIVRVKPKREIEPTLNSFHKNRGLWFDIEMLRYSGGEHRVQSRVQQLIEEKTGKMIRITNPAIMLEGVVASGEYLGFCPQAEAIMWREIWLERRNDVGRA